MSDLHLNPPMTVKRVHAAHGWILPTAAVLFAALAIGAIQGWLFWDEPITNWLVDHRTEALNNFFRRVSFFGSTYVVFAVSLAAAALSWRRCRPLAIAILVIAFARPLAEFGLKELVHRDRPVGDRLVTGTGYSFPSGHPLATAASWGMLPLVAALYTTRRLLWWSVAVAVWTLVVMVAISRVWLGVHWTSDVVAAIALAVLGVALAERLLLATHRAWGRSTSRADPDSVEASAGGCAEAEGGAALDEGDRDPARRRSSAPGKVKR
jgi:membrane-associated phospholipid phosphatase